MRFAKRVAVARGRVSDTDLITVRVTGYDDAQIIGIAQQVASNVWTNYLNVAAEADIDYPILVRHLDGLFRQRAFRCRGH